VDADREAEEVLDEVVDEDAEDVAIEVVGEEAKVVTAAWVAVLDPASDAVDVLLLDEDAVELCTVALAEEELAEDKLVLLEAVVLELVEDKLAELVEDEVVDVESDVSDRAEHLLVVSWHVAGAESLADADEKMALKEPYLFDCVPDEKLEAK
jgi:hypothetical protein